MMRRTIASRTVDGLKDYITQWFKFINEQQVFKRKKRTSNIEQNNSKDHS